MNELSANGVQIYSFPIDDETVAEANKVMNVREQLTSNLALKSPCCGLCVELYQWFVILFWQGHVPFAVVGSSDEVKIGNKMVKARQYPWGTVQGNKMINEKFFFSLYHRLGFHVWKCLVIPLFLLIHVLHTCKYYWLLLSAITENNDAWCVILIHNCWSQNLG